MNISISNLAWRKKEEKEALIFLKKKKNKFLEYTTNNLSISSF